MLEGGIILFKELKIKLTLINLVLLSVVLIIIFSGIYTLMETITDNQSNTLMMNIARRERIMMPINGKRKASSSEERRVLPDCFFIKTDYMGSIIGNSSNMPISVKEAATLIKDTFKNSKARGTVSYKSSTLKYLVMPKPSYGYIFVFSEKNPDMLNWLILTFLIIGSISLLLVFAISLFLANKALVPIKNSWEKQRVFVADASHELRTPLAVINTSLEIVLDNQAETIESQSKWLENIQSEVQRMSKLVEDLLFLARSDSNSKVMEMSKFELSSTLFQIIELFKPFTSEKGIFLDFNIEPNIFFVGNEDRIKQLVTILVDNAIQHTPQNGQISILMGIKDSSIEISVKDNGSGIPEEHLDKIFERFYKIDKARSSNHTGSGLGLSIADCITKEHNGQIIVSSTLNKGSTFKVILPKTKGI